MPKDELVYDPIPIGQESEYAERIYPTYKDQDYPLFNEDIPRKFVKSAEQITFKTWSATQDMTLEDYACIIVAATIAIMIIVLVLILLSRCQARSGNNGEYARGYHYHQQRAPATGGWNRRKHFP